LAICWMLLPVFGARYFGAKVRSISLAKSLLDRAASKSYKGFCETRPTLLFADGVPYEPTRRDFLKLTTIGGAAAAVFGFD